MIVSPIGVNLLKKNKDVTIKMLKSVIFCVDMKKNSITYT